MIHNVNVCYNVQLVTLPIIVLVHVFNSAQVILIILHIGKVELVLPFVLKLQLLNYMQTISHVHVFRIVQL